MRPDWTLTIGLLVAVACPTAVAAQPEPDIEKLRPGLVALYRDAKPADTVIVQVEPIMALALKPGEAAHPRLEADGGTVRWEGYVNVFRGGTYRFSAILSGRIRLVVLGKEVLSAQADDQTVSGPEVKLEAGLHPVVGEFTRTAQPARLELFWQLGQARREPLSYELFHHLPQRFEKELTAQRLIERGRLLVEEHGCATCHKPAAGDRMAKGLHVRRGPDLSQVGGRVHAAWLYEWLAAPHQVRPGAVMPQLFGDDEAGRAERLAVARYLASLGGPLTPTGNRPSVKEMQNSIARGQRLFNSVGCVACHRLDKPHGAQAVVLTGLGAKTTPEQLASFLQNPLALNPSGRMPHMLLQPDEARDLARFLCQQSGPKGTSDVPPLPKGHTEAGLRDLGKRLVTEKGCTQCHAVTSGGKPPEVHYAAASFDDLKNPQKADGGCLAAAPSGRTPRFPLDTADRSAVRAFLTQGASGAGSPSPVHEARATLARFNCLACHSRDGAGGLTPETVEELRKYEKAENAEAVTPPPLTGVGHKLRTSWLRQVLTQAGRARPWMGLRMPQFGAANVGQLPEALTALDGTVPDDTVHQVPLTPAKVEAGRTLVGKNALGCVSCHDIAGVPNTGTRGPDLALMNQRVRHDWYRRWLEQAQRMQPGTRMPTVFPDGRSLLPAVLGGDANAQAEAMWAYLSLGMALPLPEGLDPPKGLIVSVKDRPVVLRTFLADAGTRAVAVGYPRGVSLAFDAAACRLAYAWSGNFLDTTGVWNNRGGAPAKVLGPRFWTAPPGHPWALTEGPRPPDFAARAKDPAYGGPLPDGKLLERPSPLHFEGYSTDAAGWPTFRYRIESASVSERPAPLQSGAGIGLTRQFTLELPAGKTAWLLAGEASQAPRWHDAQGATVASNLSSDTEIVPATGRWVALPQGGERVVLMAVVGTVNGARWHLHRAGGSWQALLEIPAPKESASLSLRLDVWVPYRDDPALIKEVVERK